MAQKDTAIIILALPRNLFEPDISVIVLAVLLLLDIGLVKIYGQRIKKQRIQVQRRELGDSIMSCGCANNMSNKYGGSVYGKKKSSKKAYSSTKVRRGNMKKPSKSGKKLPSYRDY